MLLLARAAAPAGQEAADAVGSRSEREGKAIEVAQRFQPTGAPRPPRQGPAGAADPARLQALLREALSHLEGKAPEKAAAVCERMLAMAPPIAEIHFVYGCALDEMGRRAEAIEHYTKATHLNRKLFPAWLNLSIAQREEGKPREATDSAREAVGLNEQAWQAHYALARACYDTKHYNQARRAFEKAVALNPNAPELHFSYAACLQETSRFEPALQHYEKALELGHRTEMTYMRMANVLQVLGEFERCEAVLRETIERFPESTAAHVMTATTSKGQEVPAETLGRIEALLQRDDDLGDLQRANLHFAAADILNSQKSYDDAFDHYRHANTLRREHETYDYAAHQESLELTKALFTREFYEAHSDYGTASEQMIFIFGMPRSGTTLTEQVLASHPRVGAAGEAVMLRHIRVGLDRMPVTAKTMARVLEQMGRDESRQLAETIVKTLPAELHDRDRITEKTPAHHRMLGLFALLFPKATFIHCRRDPVDTCLSCYFQNFAHGNVTFSFDLETLAREYRLYSAYMAHWREVLPVTMLELDYENMIADPEYWSRALVDHAGLEWDDACLSFYDTKRSVKTASLWQVRQPIYKTSVAKWKRYEAHLGPLIDGLGELGPLGGGAT